MSKPPRHPPGKGKPARTYLSTNTRKTTISKDKLAIDQLINQAMPDVEHDRAALHDWFISCSRKYPQFFKGWSIEQFKRWNDIRMSHLDDPPPPLGTTEQESAKLHRATGNRTWDAATGTLANDPKTPHLDA